MQRLSTATVINLLLVYIVWGSTYLAISLAVAVWPPFLLGFTRFVAAGILLLAVARLRGESIRLDRRSLVTSVVGGLVFFPVGNGAVIWAEQATSSGLVATLIATVPLWMVLFGWVLKTGPRPSVRMFASIGLGVAGVAVLVMRGRTAVSASDAAVLVVGAIAWAFASVWTAKRQPTGSLAARSAYQMIAGGAGFAVLSLLAGEAGRLSPALFSPQPLLAISYLVVLGSCVGFLAFAWLVSNCPPHITGTYAFVNPVVAVGLGALFGEQITTRGILATLMVVAGVILSLSGGKEPRSVPAAERSSGRTG